MEKIDFSNGWVVFALVAFLMWTLFWKGPALWKSARRGDVAWFVVLLLLNTVGIVDILYLFFFSRKEKQTDEHPGSSDAGWHDAQVF